MSLFHKPFAALLVMVGPMLDSHTVKPVLSNHMKQDLFLTFQADGCLLLDESSAESSCFLLYFQSAINNHMSVAISMSPEWMVT